MSEPARAGRLATAVAAALAADGPIARGLRSVGINPEDRAGQRDMAALVARGIAESRTVLCEAGTGTGKTIAYLVPAILSGKRVVVSTATKALQEQVFTKDLPLLAEHLGVNVSAALMKGLANYVCLRRLNEALAMTLPGDERARVLGRIEQWAKSTESGDRAELDLRDDDPAWRDVQSGSDTRIGQGCAYYDRCLVTKMRAAAQEAQLVVVNHHLYLADLALRRGGARQGVIAPHDVVIFDEAHQLEEIATDFFGARVSTARIDALLRDARRTLAANGHVEVKKTVEQIPLLRDVGAAAQALFSIMASAASRLSASGPPGTIGDATRVPLPHDAWDDVAVVAKTALDESLHALAGWCDSLERGGAGEEIAAIARRVEALREDLTRVAQPTPDDVAWIEVRARSASIGVSPLELSPIFARELFSGGGERSPRSVVLTSATLATAGGSDPFAHAKRRLGIFRAAPRIDDEDDEAHFPGMPTASNDAPLQLVVASPFDYRAHAALYVPVDLPEPNDSEFIRRAAARILELIAIAQGGAFVLCASSRNMNAFAAHLREAELPYPLFVQGERPKTALLDAFREAGSGVLVATMGFWEGVDVPGRALRLVIIDKLPFAVPTDPVVAARARAIEERGGSSFAELSLPEAAIALKQGFGRLIRSSTDVGVVAVLDKRLRTKGYGRGLLRTLPPASALGGIDQVRQFFEVVVGQRT
jgi:ATP-dependent DNA helicase DinG